MDSIFFFFSRYVTDWIHFSTACGSDVSRVRRVDEKREDYDTAINYVELIVF